ncbi:phosphonate ABC transporter, permease protein PhnE [Nesterenkonia sandarakina]|uniref:Phosphonate transport system permease protein n=1 Tax=Nesterenkonia sandarakina TaxID=272918 RepID=A0A2T0YR55_9MICC|nr:phosphonate ABC transporter, permease protein PhnE [Nesterenkonia sandarakina]PRZ17868.1 phosphonate transport system permease protein [Nesterenkonia sandarakina]
MAITSGTSSHSTASHSPATHGASTLGATPRPEAPKPSGLVYLGLGGLAVVAFIIFWITGVSGNILLIPLGFVTLWAPLYPVIGLAVMLLTLLVCFRARTNTMGAFGALAFIIMSYWAGSTVNFTLLEIPERWSNVEPRLMAFLDPNWSYIWTVRDQWLITLSMAVVATLIGCAIGLVLAMFASPVSSPNKGVSQAIKAVNSVIRSIPDVGWALLFVAFIGGTAHGLGPMAGVLALLMFNIGIVAKLLSETIDSVNPGPVEAADAAGANLTQRNRLAILPQVLPGFVSYGLYVFELNIRASAALGIVGVGGIGSAMMLQLNRFAFENVAAILIALIIVVLLVDMFSMYIRRKLL